MLLHNFQCRSYSKNRLLMIPNIMLGLGFSFKVLASANPPPNYEQTQKTGSNAAMIAQTALNQSFDSRGPAKIAFDELPVTPYTVTTETGQSFTLNAGYFTKRCNSAGGCVNVLQFQHR